MKVNGILHVHSTYSYDGKESLVSLKDFLKRKGINFCCLTEHTDFFATVDADKFVAECRSLSDSEFVFIPGFEVPYKNAHILLVGTTKFLAQKADAEILERWSKEAALTILAHPVRNKFTVDEVMKRVINGVEIWNQQYGGKLVPRVRSVRLLQALKRANKNLLATGGTDFHRREHFGSPIFELKLNQLSEREILSALKAGKYTFGSNKIKVSSKGMWAGRGAKDYWQSVLSVTIINLGKGTNAVLDKAGIRLPKGLKQLIRSRI